MMHNMEIADQPMQWQVSVWDEYARSINVGLQDCFAVLSSRLKVNGVIYLLCCDNATQTSLDSILGLTAHSGTNPEHSPKPLASPYHASISHDGWRDVHTTGDPTSTSGGTLVGTKLRWEAYSLICGEHNVFFRSMPRKQTLAEIAIHMQQMILC